MPKPHRPRLTRGIVRGLEHVRALTDVNLFEGSDLYQGATSPEIDDINDAVQYLGRLIWWWDKTHAARTRGTSDDD